MSTRTTQEASIHQVHAKLAQAQSELVLYKARAEYISIALKLYGDALTDLRARLNACAMGVDANFVARIAANEPVPEMWRYECEAAVDVLVEKESFIADAHGELRRLEQAHARTAPG